MTCAKWVFLKREFRLIEMGIDSSCAAMSRRRTIYVDWSHIGVYMI